VKKFGYKFRRDYSITVIPRKSNEIKFGRRSSRKQRGGSKQEDGTYLNPLKMLERLDDTTILIDEGKEIPRAVTVHKGVTYLSCGFIQDPTP